MVGDLRSEVDLLDPYQFAYKDGRGSLGQLMLD